ncbi:DUF424 family protein [Candidatus Woesearchaeota archaeon]|nr:DUF424 family protein [Candidatus Woesearchaeota archaeon]
MNFTVAQKQSHHGLLLVVTDSEIMGKKFEEGKFQLDLTKEFYQGEKKNKEEVKELFLTARHIHLTGKAAVAIAVEMDYIEANKILWIKGIPHAEIVSE